MYFRNIAALLLLATIGVYTGASAQQTESFRSEYRPYHDAVELMGHAQYEAARKGFESFLDQQTNQRGELYVNAAYYRALCTIKLFHRDGERLMSTFALDFPESVWVNPAILELGRYNFNRRDFKDSYYYFNTLDPHDLDADVRDEVKFKLGFSAFELGKIQEARGHFYDLKSKQGEYYGATNYYYGHIAYTEGNYQTALESFEKAATDEKFAPVVPYYIVHIYHYQQKYDELISYAQPMLDSASTGKKQEIARLLGNAHYQKQDYAQAQPYLELYMTSPGATTQEDNYQVAYTYYRNKEYKTSIDYFAKAARDDNKLGQVATYQMADAYVQMSERKYAQNAFRTASQMDYDPEVTEDALFNYAKLAYELSYDPFHEAIQAFERYLSTYPNSSRKDEAYAFLLKVHLSTKNYKAAIGAIEKMKAPSPVDKANFQLSAYNYAVQEMRKGNNEEAFTYFKMAKKYREDAGIVALADYWAGDLKYRKGEYPEAINSYNTFLANSAAVGTDYFNTANYNIGYCHFKTGDYGASLTAFRKYTSAQKENPKRRNDALLRIGDLHLVNKQYDLAIKSYQEALAMNVLNGDYALYNIGMAYGYQEQFDKKIAALNDMMKRFPETSLTPVGRYELGDSYFLQNNLSDALSSLNIVINDYGQSPYRKKALLKRGLVEYRMNKYDDAIASYKKVVSEYGVDSESKEAIAVLRSIYLDLGKIDEYTAWLNKVPNYSISPTEIDSLTYQAAQNLIADGNCTEAVNAFDKYLIKFPAGLFATNANYYQADCAYRQNNFDLAIKGFEYVATQPIGKFTESALYGAAAIRFSRKEYSEALVHYEKLEQVATFASNKLEAQIGRMRCHYQLKAFSPALDAANQVIHAEGATEAFITEARLTRGNIRLDQKNYVEARTDFKWLSENSKVAAGAEAKYRLGQISLAENKLEEAENHVFELVKNFNSYEYWKIEGFMLLAEVYIARKDYFQARATLQSVADNVEDQNIVNRAKARLKFIENAEADANKPAAPIISSDDEEYKNLIDDK